MSEAEHWHDWIRQAMVGDKKSLDPAYCRTCPAIRRGGQVVMPDNQSALQATTARAEAAEAEVDRLNDKLRPIDDVRKERDDFMEAIRLFRPHVESLEAALDEAKKALRQGLDGLTVDKDYPESMSAEAYSDKWRRADGKVTNLVAMFREALARIEQTQEGQP